MKKGSKRSLFREKLIKIKHFSWNFQKICTIFATSESTTLPIRTAYQGGTFILLSNLHSQEKRRSPPYAPQVCDNLNHPMGSLRLLGASHWMIDFARSLFEVAVRGANEQIKCRAPKRSTFKVACFCKNTVQRLFFQL